MITCTIIENKVDKKTKLRKVNRFIKIFKSLDKAKEYLTPITIEMVKAKKEHRKPNIYVHAVSFDSKTEKELLVGLGAIETSGQEGDLLL